MAEIDAQTSTAAGARDHHLFGVVAGPMIELFGGAQAEGMKVVGNRLELNGLRRAPGLAEEKRLRRIGPGGHELSNPLYVATESAMPPSYSADRRSRGRRTRRFQSSTRSPRRSPFQWTGRVDSTERIGEWVRLAVGKALEGKPGGVTSIFRRRWSRGSSKQTPSRPRCPRSRRRSPTPTPSVAWPSCSRRRRAR